MIKTITVCLLLLLAAGIGANQQDSFEFGKRMYRDGFYTEASLVFERIVRTAPTSQEAEESLYLLAEISRNQRNYQQAEIYYRDLYERYPRGNFRERALLNWAISLFQQERYNAAVEIFNNFVESYPASLQREVALSYLIESYYSTASYQAGIELARNFLELFPKSDKRSDVYLLMVKLYQLANMQNDAENTIGIIFRDYPNSDARWKAASIRADMISESKGDQEAIVFLNTQLNANTPREYEELIRYRIARLHFSRGDNQKVADETAELIRKFDRSERLVDFVALYTTALIRLNRYQTITTFYESFDEYLAEEVGLFDYKLNVAESFFYRGRLDETRAIIGKIKDREISEQQNFRVAYWEARLKEESGQLFEAINDYQNLVNRYPSLVNREELLMRIGDIYYDRLGMYQTAIRFFDQVVTSVSSESDYYWRALYRMALCYEVMGEYKTALNTMRLINVNQITPESEREEFLRRANLLSGFKIVDYEEATKDLITGLYQYLLSDEKDLLKNTLLRTLLNSMNDYSSLLAILSNDQTPQGLYLKGRANLKGLQRADLERRDSDKRRYLNNLNQLITDLSRHNSQEFTQELTIERDLVNNSNKMNEQLIIQTERFLTAYPNSPAVNRFRFYLGSHYLENRLFVKADQFFSSITEPGDLPVLEYERALIALSDYFFTNERYDRVINYLSRISERISLMQPEVLYKFSVAQIETGDLVQGISNLELLVKNVTGFSGQRSSLDIVTKHHRNKRSYETVIQFMEMYPLSQRDKAYYLLVSDDYLNLGNKLKAKESLMLIEDKSNVVLLKLAELHYLTGDMVMAEFTYNDLLRTDITGDLRIKAESMLAHINFHRENWREAVSNYEKVLTRLGERFSVSQYPDLDLVRIGKETVISLYRTQNRPRAETIAKRFEDILKTDATALAEIELNKGVYLMEINRNQAERAFTSLIRDRDIPELVRQKAHFWRGVNHLENRKPDDAMKDFEAVLVTNDLRLKNEAHLKLGTISFSKERYPQALDHYYTVIQSDLSGDLAFNAAKNFAIVCKTIEEWQKAIEAYEIILERWGDSGLEGETIFNIAFCQFRDRNYTEAVRMFERAITLIDDRELKAEAQYWIGENYFSMGQFENAATEFLKVGYFYPDIVHWNAVSELKLAESYIRQGRLENARGVLQRVITKYGRSSDWGRQAASFLEQI